MPEEIIEENLHLDNEFRNLFKLFKFYFEALEQWSSFLFFKFNQKDIELCDEGQDMPDLVKKPDANLAQGVKYAYEMPAETTSTQLQAETSESTESVALEDLMAKLKGL